MTSALRHAIYSAILNTEAAATFMFLPASTARVHLNNQNPAWLQGLARDIPKAKCFVKKVSNSPIRNARHAAMPKIGICEKLLLDKKQIAKAPHNPATDRPRQLPGSGRYDSIRGSGAGITDTIGRSELAAIAAALTHKYTYIATDSLSSPHQLRKQILYPGKHRHHVQGDVLKTISNLARTSQDHIFFYKVKSHAGIAGNECADTIAKY
eukprot:1137293-Pelagomonas_calceolata.AAC.1